MVAIIGFYVLFSLFNWTSLKEDSYIIFRFVENIAAGDGYVFNPRGERIERCDLFPSATETGG